MKVLLANPPWITDSFNYGIRAGARSPQLQTIPQLGNSQRYLPFPFFLAYAASVLERGGFNVTLIDAIAENMDLKRFIERIVFIQPDIIFLETSSPTLSIDLELIKTLKKELKFSPLIGLGGPAIIHNPSDILKNSNFVDFVTIGEYEFSLLNYCKQVKDNFHNFIPGLLTRVSLFNTNSDYEHQLCNLDELPFPARHLLKMDLYDDSFCNLPKPNMQLWSSRGCPFKCIYCLWPFTMYKPGIYRKRRPQDIINEINNLREKYNFNSFYFDDDTFNIDKKHVQEISWLLKTNEINLPWAAMMRADLVDEEQLRVCMDSNLYAVKYGVESSSQNLLDNCNKQMKIENTIQGIILSKQLGLKIHLSFTFGLPGETIQTINETIKLALELDVDSTQFSITTPYPGTPFYEMALNNSWLRTLDYKNYICSRTSVIDYEQLDSAELENCLVKAYLLWYQKKGSEFIIQKNNDSLNFDLWWYIRGKPFKLLKRYSTLSQAESIQNRLKMGENILEFKHLWEF